MNILIPHSWLLEHLDTKADPDTIRKNLSLCGPSVERVEKTKTDVVYDIEVTTNRIDSMSVRGIAQESATILPEFGIPAKLKPLNLTQTYEKITSRELPELDITINNDSKLSKRIVAIKLENISLGPSPKWMQDRLEAVGQRPLNNAIDITNYCMWEIGHPIHAFDYDKLAKKNITVRLAKKGEKITTLDHKTHTLLGGEVVFDDSTGKIIDLPGIMGTENTVVSDETKNVLLWIESIDAVKIRKASMGLAIRTQAAILNEKSVDPSIAIDAITRGVQLYIDICKAKVGSKLKDIYNGDVSVQPIALSQSKLDTYLGIQIPAQRVSTILTNLGCQVETRQNSTGDTDFLVSPPLARRNDLTIYQDLIEEIARIYGYHNLDSTIMATPIPDTPTPENFELEYAVKTTLTGWGLNEVYTYSMISAKKAIASDHMLEDHLKIKNPLTDEMVYLRISLIPSLLEVFDDNPGKKVSVFEMQNVFHKSPTNSNLPTEELELAVMSNESYSHIKGILDGLCATFYLSDVEVIPQNKNPIDGYGKYWGQIQIGNEVLGTIGQMKDPEVYGFVIKMSQFQKHAHTHPSYIPIVSTPPIVEDLTFAIKNGVNIAPIMKKIKSNSQLIESVVLKDTYSQAKDNSINYTFTLTYRDKTKPLSDSTLPPVRKAIAKSLSEEFQAKLVGSV